MGLSILILVLGGGWILGQGIYPFLKFRINCLAEKFYTFPRRIKSRFFDFLDMEASNYQIYDFSLVQNGHGQVWINPGVKINLLEGLYLQNSTHKVSSITDYKILVRNILIKIAKILAFLGFSLILIFFLPLIFNYFAYRLSSSEVDNLKNSNKTIINKGNLPPFNPLLPKTNRLIIPSIGVSTDIEEATNDNYESALKKGVWRVSDFGEPNQGNLPIILAAHRYGYLAWTNSYRHFNSFYNLPKVKVGDTVVIDWEQREYTYGVYKVESGREIADYSADLILYTCENLSGDKKDFVYARRLN